MGGLRGAARDGHPGERLWGTWAGRAGQGWCLGVSRSAPPLLRTDDGEGAAPAGGPSPMDGPCSPGERWVQGTRASPWQLGLPSHGSLLSPSPDAQWLRLHLPLAPWPSRPKGAVVLPAERRGVPLGEIPRLSWPCKTFSAQDLDSHFGVWVGGITQVSPAREAVCPRSGHRQRKALGAGSQALSFSNRERKATEGPQEREASPVFLGREGRPAAQGSQVTRVPGAPRVLLDSRGPRDHQAPGEPGAHPCPPPSLRDRRTR